MGNGIWNFMPAFKTKNDLRMGRASSSSVAASPCHRIKKVQKNRAALDIKAGKWVAQNQKLFARKQGAGKQGTADFSG